MRTKLVGLTDVMAKLELHTYFKPHLLTPGYKRVLKNNGYVTLQRLVGRLWDFLFRHETRNKLGQAHIIVSLFTETVEQLFKTVLAHHWITQTTRPGIFSLLSPVCIYRLSPIFTYQDVGIRGASQDDEAMKILRDKILPYVLID